MRRCFTTITALCALLAALLLPAFAAPAQKADALPCVKVTQFPGYVHKTVADDNSVSYVRNAAAARDILLHAARLQALDGVSEPAADVNFDGRVTSGDARILLRCSAGLCGFPVKLQPHQTLDFGPFVHLWTAVALTESTPALTVEREIIPAADPEDLKPGDAESFLFHVTPTAEGVYTFQAQYLDYTDRVVQDVRFDIICTAENAN